MVRFLRHEDGWGMNLITCHSSECALNFLSIPAQKCLDDVEFRKIAILKYFIFLTALCKFFYWLFSPLL
jgi:hypothetical protein